MGLALLLAASLSVASGCEDAREKFINDYHDKHFSMGPGTRFPYKGNSFLDGVGALVCASRERGEQALVMNARNKKLEESWIYFPLNDMWLNITRHPTLTTVNFDRHFDFVAKGIEGPKEYFHTHPQFDFTKMITGEEQVYENPSRIDLGTAYKYAFAGFDDIEFAVASSKGVRHYKPIDGSWKHTEKRFVEIARSELKNPHGNRTRVLETYFTPR